MSRQRRQAAPTQQLPVRPNRLPEHPGCDALFGYHLLQQSDSRRNGIQKKQLLRRHLIHTFYSRFVKI